MVEEEKERIMNLFDSYWYYKLPLITKIPVHEEKSIRDGQIKLENRDESKFERLPSLRVRSLSDQNLNTSFKKVFYDSDLSSNSNDSEISPSSVLLPKLQTILSGKEMKTNRDESKNTETPSLMSRDQKKINTKIKGRRKSYSELEFEEVKGFIDLGFVFSEEAKKNSMLVSLVPGLQRLGEKNICINNGKEEIKMMSSRPAYLSDAWKRKKESSFFSSSSTTPLNRRLSLDNEAEMRDHLKNWAHTIASTIK